MAPEPDVLAARLRYPKGVAGASGFTHSVRSISHKRLCCNMFFIMSPCMHEALKQAPERPESACRSDCADVHRRTDSNLLHQRISRQHWAQRWIERWQGKSG